METMVIKQLYQGEIYVPWSPCSCLSGPVFDGASLVRLLLARRLSPLSSRHFKNLEGLQM